MIIYALPLIPNNLFWWLSTGINRLFITGMLGIAASGMFAAASKTLVFLTQLIWFFSRLGSCLLIKKLKTKK